jgi:glycosyltransferase 2 family protein
VVAGAAFCFWPMVLPDEWKIDNGGLRVLGAVLLLLAAAYLVLCAFANGHVFRIRQYRFKVPALRMALLQLAMSCLNWSLIGGVIWVLLQGQVAYHQVLAVLLVAAVAGVVTHVPAGLGVLEAVFIALLSHQVPQGKLLGVLLVYRGLYYLLPLAVATVAYFVTELRTRRLRTTTR